MNNELKQIKEKSAKDQKMMAQRKDNIIRTQDKQIEELYEKLEAKSKVETEKPAAPTQAKDEKKKVGKQDPQSKSQKKSESTEKT